jgi:hypothetical protein
LECGRCHHGCYRAGRVRRSIHLQVKDASRSCISTNVNIVSSASHSIPRHSAVTAVTACSAAIVVGRDADQLGTVSLKDRKNSIKLGGRTTSFRKKLRTVSVNPKPHSESLVGHSVASGGNRYIGRGTHSSSGQFRDSANHRHCFCHIAEIASLGSRRRRERWRTRCRGLEVALHSFRLTDKMIWGVRLVVGCTSRILRKLARRWVLFIAGCFGNTMEFGNC